MEKPFNILIAGVGGQGSLLAGDVIASAAVTRGYRPVVGQTFGASRRGGSVLTHLRFWNTDLGPLIPYGKADILIGLEPMETLRAAISHCGPKTKIIASPVRVHTASTLSGEEKYPDEKDVLNSLARICKEVYSLDRLSELDESLASRSLNMYVVGFVASLIDEQLPKIEIRNSIAKLVSPADASLRSFDNGAAALESTHPYRPDV
ncbi:MAG: 2-oxoacid:acceptor oxidoreductase family protein [Candidatus Thorarchaeota archaeon]|jgi:indolepyruvate ferredoxin oxidoreductase beta subunit